MKKEMVHILCCPTCKGDLTLQITKEDKNNIISGSLTCSHCNVVYMITNGIPDLLPR